MATVLLSTYETFKQLTNILHACRYQMPHAWFATAVKGLNRQYMTSKLFGCRTDDICFSNAFIWDQTPEGQQFWSKIDAICMGYKEPVEVDEREVI